MDSSNGELDRHPGAFATNRSLQGIFGMEFFEMDPKTQRLMTSPQIWIYFVTALCATLFTICLYYAMPGLWQLRRKQRDVAEQGNNVHVPKDLQRGYTDIEKSTQGSGA